MKLSDFIAHAGKVAHDKGGYCHVTENTLIDWHQQAVKLEHWGVARVAAVLILAAIGGIILGYGIVWTLDHLLPTGAP